MKKLLLVLLVLIIELGMNSTLWADGTQPPGSGTSGDPYLVSTLNHLLWISTNSGSWGSYFKQTANIDATDTQNWNSGAGFSPIGNSGTKFTGSYDGQNYTIDAIYISRSGTDYIGFFGYTDNANISNLGLTNVNITGQSYTGGLKGYNYNTSSSKADTIINCYSTGTVSGTGNIGGLIGYNYPGKIDNCYSSSSVSGAYYVGGLIGETGVSYISNCYSTGSVSATMGPYAGGFCYYNDGSTIEDCYSTGSVSEGGAGFVYANGSNSITDCFWDTQTSGKSTGIIDGTTTGVTGKTTAEMKDYTTFTAAGWDFVSETVNGTNDYWDADQTGTVNSGYMILAWQNGADTSLPVELMSFTAAANDGIVTLQWTTESEIENLGFILERMTEQSGWREIANYRSDSELQGHGSTSMRHEYQYSDKTVQPGMTYTYRLGDVDYRGNVTWHKTVEITVDDKDDNFPAEFLLRSAYPNPFNPKISIPLALPEAAEVRITIYDLTGREVKILFRGNAPAGRLNLIWDGSDTRGKSVGAGIYFLTCNLTSLTSDRMYRFNQKIVMVK